VAAAWADLGTVREDRDRVLDWVEAEGRVLVDREVGERAVLAVAGLADQVCGKVPEDRAGLVLEVEPTPVVAASVEELRAAVERVAQAEAVLLE
jgi:hypothetical protein